MAENRTAPDIATELTPAPKGVELPGEPGRVPLAVEPLGDGPDDCIVLGYN